jgi:hypothetical protein
MPTSAAVIPPFARVASATRPKVIKVILGTRGGQGPPGDPGPPGPQGPPGTGANGSSWFLSTAEAQAANIPVSNSRVIVTGTNAEADPWVSYSKWTTGAFDLQTADGQKWIIETAAPGIIRKDVTYQVGPGQQFLEPGDFVAWVGRKRIAPGVTVTANIASGTYNISKRIRGHVDGERIKWTNAGLNGAPLVGADFASLDAMWVLDVALGFNTPAGLASIDAAKAAAEPIVRAKYKVIFQFDGAVEPAFSCDNKHSGDWSGCPCLWINTGSCDDGVTTGSGSNVHGEGAGGVGIFEGSCFFGFRGANMYTDYGGIINFRGGLSLFPGQICQRADFNGGFYGANQIIIGGPQYGFRCNHGGFNYMDTAYIRGCQSALECTNSPGMFWAHNSDIQYNGVGANVNYGGSGKVVNATVKNNSVAQIRVANNGTIDARSTDIASTATNFRNGATTGLPPLYGVNVPMAGLVICATIPAAGFRTTVISGHSHDVNLDGSGTVNLLGVIFTPGNLKYGVTTVTPAADGLLGYPQSVPIARPAIADVAVSGTTLILPNPCPQVLAVVQPAGSAGTPITINAIDNSALPVGGRFIINAANAITGETVTVNDGADLSLKSALRYLGNVRDTLEFYRPNNTGSVCEVAFAANFNNSSGDTKSVRVFIAVGSIAFTQSDDVVVVNKTAGAATAVNIDAALNYAGRDVEIVDGKGDAAANPITITPGGGKTINGAAAYVINTNYGVAKLRYNGTEFNISYSR